MGFFKKTDHEKYSKALNNSKNKPGEKTARKFFGLLPRLSFFVIPKEGTSIQAAMEGGLSSPILKDKNGELFFPCFTESSLAANWDESLAKATLYKVTFNAVLDLVTGGGASYLLINPGDISEFNIPTEDLTSIYQKNGATEFAMKDLDQNYEDELLPKVSSLLKEHGVETDSYFFQYVEGRGQEELDQHINQGKFIIVLALETIPQGIPPGLDELSAAFYKIMENSETAAELEHRVLALEKNHLSESVRRQIPKL